jgi:hypothetical protein
MIRAVVDLHRFKLLEKLMLPSPPGIRDERVLWRGLRTLSAYGSRDFDMSYRQDKTG